MQIVSFNEMGTVQLKEKGRLQYFYHCPSSTLPIRDVNNEQGEGFKTEPHIEMGGENFLKSCFQTSIRSHAQNLEKYMFLMTTCRNLEHSNVYGIKSIVGYIDTKGSGVRLANGEKKHFILGEPHIFSFSDAIPLTELGYSNWTRVKLVNEEDTGTILNRFEGLENIVQQCVDEIQKFDINGKTCIKNKGECYFRKECRRYS